MQVASNEGLPELGGQKKFDVINRRDDKHDNPERLAPQANRMIQFVQVFVIGMFFIHTALTISGKTQPSNVVRIKLGLTEYEVTHTYNVIVVCAGFFGLTLGVATMMQDGANTEKSARKNVMLGFGALTVLGLGLSLTASIWSILAGRILHGVSTGVFLTAGSVMDEPLAVTIKANKDALKPKHLKSEDDQDSVETDEQTPERDTSPNSQKGVASTGNSSEQGGANKFLFTAKFDNVDVPKSSDKVNYETVILPVNTLPEEITAPNKLSNHILSSRIIQQIKGQIAAKGQRPRIMAGVTMYNEDESELQHTMQGIVRNHQQLSKDKRFNFGDDELVVVCICDGYEKIPQSFKSFATEEQLYDEGILKKNGFMITEDGMTKMRPVRDVNATMEKADAPQANNFLHLFHKRTMCQAENSEGCTPVNVIFALKQENRGKTDSLRWLMRGFCRALEVDYYFMTDTGSRMLDTCLTKMIAYMEYMPKCAGVGVERYVDFRPTPDMSWTTYCVLAYQVLEYKFTCMTQGSAALWGYQTTFQGNCCVLRAPALREEVCAELFYFEENPGELPTALEGNYCLVEDSKVDNALLTNWAYENHVEFIFDAAFETDCPKDVSTWLKQRRRWSNGDVAAILFNLSPRKSMNMMSHGLMRTIGCLDYQFNNLHRLFRWIEIPLLPLEMAYAMASRETFIALIVMNFLIWLASAILPLNRGVSYIMGFCLIMSTINGYIYFMLFVEHHYRQEAWRTGEAEFQWAFIPMWVTSVQPLLYFMLRPWMCIERAWHMIVGIIATLPLSSLWPAQTLYQYANLHDVTWGNRPISKKAEAELTKKKDDYLQYRFDATLCILAIQCVHFYLFAKYLDKEDPVWSGSMAFLMWKGALLTLWRNTNCYLGALRYYLLSYFCFHGAVPAKLQKWN